MVNNLKYYEINLVINIFLSLLKFNYKIKSKEIHSLEYLVR